MEPSEAVREFFRLRDIWSRPPEGQSEKVPLLCGVEAVAYQESLISLIQEEMSRRDDFFVLEKIRYSTEKRPGFLEPYSPDIPPILCTIAKPLGNTNPRWRNFPLATMTNLTWWRCALTSLRTPPGQLYPFRLTAGLRNPIIKMTREKVEGSRLSPQESRVQIEL